MFMQAYGLYYVALNFFTTYICKRWEGKDFQESVVLYKKHVSLLWKDMQKLESVFHHNEP